MEDIKTAINEIDCYKTKDFDIFDTTLYMARKTNKF